MTRIKNTTFTGSPMVDVDVDAATYRRTVVNAAGDTALVYDMVTGENAEANTVNHSGPGRGSLLGVPLVNQWLGIDLALTSFAASGDGSRGPAYILAVPVFVPPGETTYDVLISGDRYVVGMMRVTMIDATTGALVSDAYTTAEPGRFTLEGCTTGWRVLIVTWDTRYSAGESSSVGTLGGDAVVQNRIINSWAVFPHRQGAAQTYSVGVGANGGVTDPGATGATFWRDLFTDQVAQGLPITGVEVSTINRAQNGLYEYMTAAPAMQNAAYTHVDRAASTPLTNPDYSQFLAHTRSVFADEGQVAWPLWCRAFGASNVDGTRVVDAAEPPTLGMLGWYAPWVLTTSASPADADFATFRVEFPDFPVGANSKLSWAILASSDDGDLKAEWAGRMTIDGTPYQETFIDIPGTTLAIAIGTNADFTADARLDIKVGAVNDGTAWDETRFGLMGAALAFDPTT